MIGVILAAGGGTRLRPLTDDLPKTLLEIDGSRSIYELGVANMADVGIKNVMVVTGHAAKRICDINPILEKRYGVTITEVFNDRYADWNNAYSLWLARDAFQQGVLLVNGDTVHPASVQQRVLDGRDSAPIVLALDDKKSLAEEEMKVRLDDAGHMMSINKALSPADVHGEYIGITWISPASAEELASSLEATFERDPGLYYEDGFQEFADRGGIVRTVPVGTLDWVEVDNHDDLARARTLACHY